MRSFGLINILLTCLLTLSLIGLTFFSVIHKNFKDLPSVLSFLQNAQVYNNASILIKLEIQDNYPPILSKNIILRGIADQLVNIIVTPRLVATVAKPAIQASFAFAQAPTSIINDKVVIATSQYKDQANQVISDFGLPKLVVRSASLLINALPSQLTIVNLKKHPNSVFGIIIKIRGILEQNNAARISTWILVVGLFLLSFLYNLRHVKKLVELLLLVFGISGGLYLLLYALLPIIFSLLLPTGSAIMEAQNTLILDAIMYLFKQMMFVSLFFLGVSIICAVLLRFIRFEKLQKKIDKILKKLHIPTVSVEIKS